VTVAGVWESGPDAAVVRSGTSEKAPVIGRIVPSWNDGELRLTIEPAGGAAVRTTVFERTSGGGAAALDRGTETRIALQGTYRATLHATGGGDAGWLSVDIDPEGATRFSGDLPPAIPPALAAAFARIQNEQLAKLAKARPDRFLAIATLPMQAPKQAADELRHAVRVLGLRGAQIGSNVAGKNLDDPELEPVWATAAELDAFILLHPINVAGADRLSSYYLGNLIGNPLDTTIAAACLVFSGVLERHPSLKVCLAHGGGFVPYQAGRFLHGWHVRAEPKRKLDKPPTDSLIRKRCSHSSSATRAPTACCSAATIPSTWACRRACRRFAACRFRPPSSRPFLAGGHGRCSAQATRRGRSPDAVGTDFAG